MTAVLDPAVAAHLAAQAAEDLGYVGVPSLAEARRAAAAGQASGTSPHEAVLPSRDILLPLAGRDIRARAYPPPGRPTDGASPVILWYHGGGFVLCDLDSADGICSRLATATGATVLSVDYRLAPETPWPAAHRDAADALVWVRDNSDKLGLDAARVAVAGDSAGATLAAHAATHAAASGIPLSAQVLFYPVVSTAMDTASYEEFADGFGLLRDEMAWFFGHYGVLDGAAAADFDEALAHPRSSLAPLHLVTAECDVLRDEGEAYGRAAQAAGVAVTAVRYLGMPHGFVQMTGVTPMADAALAGAARELRRALGIGEEVSNSL